MKERITSVIDKIALDQVLFWMLSLTILLDYVNGIVPALKLGIIFRVILLGVCLLILLKNDIAKFKLTMVIYAYLILGSIVSFFRHRSFYGIYYDFSMLLKTTSCLVILMTLICLYHKGIYTKQIVEKVLLYNTIYMPLLFAVAKILDIGTASYVGVSVGFRGTFLSLNSINTAMVVIYVYTVFKFVHTMKPIWMVAMIYTAVPMLLLGTKTGMLVVAVAPVLSIILNLDNKKGRKMALALGVIVLIGGIVFGGFIMEAMNDIIARQVYLFQNRDFFSYLFSGRNWMLEIAYEYYADNMNLFEKIFGQGYFLPHHELSKITGYLATANVRPIEMDWADLIIGYGVWGLLFTYLPILYLLVKTFKKFRNPENQNYYCSILLLIAFGSLAGHVFTEAISSTFLAIAAAGLYMNSDLKQESCPVTWIKRKWSHGKQ